MTSSGLTPGATLTTDQSRRGLAAALVCLVTVVAFETMSVATIMPKVLDDIGGLPYYGWVFSGLSLGEIIGIVVAGGLIDRGSLVKPTLLGLFVYSVGLVISGVAPSMLIVVVGRVFQGFGAGTIPAVAYVCVGRGFTETDRPRVFAWMSTAWIVPSMVGPIVAVKIAAVFGWRWVFLGLIPVVVLVGALAIRPIGALDAATSERLAELDRGATYGPAFIAVVGIGAVLGALQYRSLLVALPMAALGVSVAAAAALRLTPPGTLRARSGMPAAIAARGVLTFSFFGADAFITLALTGVRHTSSLFAGVALSSAALTWTVGAWASARLVLRLGARPLVTYGVGFVAIGIACMTITIGTAVPVEFGVVAWLIAGWGIGLAYAPLTQVVLSTAPPSEVGFSTAALQLSDVVGAALGTGLAGASIAIASRNGIKSGGSALHAGLNGVWTLTIAAAIFGLFVAWRVGPESLAPDANPA